MMSEWCEQVAKGTPVVIDIPNVEPLIWMAVLQAIYTDQVILVVVIILILSCAHISNE